MTEQDQLDKNEAKSTALVGDDPAELVKGLVKQGAYDIAKSFIDFLATRDKEAKKEPKSSSKEPKS